MVGAKMLYLVENESEMSYAYGPDAAYCIGGKEIRVPTPAGVKVFVAKETQPSVDLNDILARLTALEAKAAHQTEPKATNYAF